MILVKWINFHIVLFMLLYNGVIGSSGKKSIFNVILFCLNFIENKIEI